jgi:hypothetical protein
MATVAVRSAIARGQTAPRSASTHRRVRVTHRPKMLLRKNARYAFLFAALVGVFGYVALYANLTATSFDRSRMMNEFKGEQIKNERLRVEYVRRVSPASAMDAARKTGMVYAVDYDYLGKSNTVARADQDK